MSNPDKLRDDMLVLSEERAIEIVSIAGHVFPALLEDLLHARFDALALREAGLFRNAATTLGLCGRFIGEDFAAVGHLNACHWVQAPF